MWNVNEWFFEPGPADGFNDSGISSFKDIKYDGLAREIIQNSLDAKDEASLKPVKVIFEKKYFDTNLFPAFDDYCKTVDRCIEYINDQKTNSSLDSLKEIKDFLISYKKSGKIPVLVVSDYNTTGLSGYRKQKGSSWSDLLKVHGNNNKTSGSGGSYGIGKFAPFVFSNIRSIIYSSKNSEEGIAVQGKSILSGHINGEKKTPRGFYGLIEEIELDNTSIIDNDCFPFQDESEIPKEYIREENGTSLFIMGAKTDESWFDEVIVSVIVSFFYAIYNKTLLVEIRDNEKKISIDDSNLFDLIQYDYNYLNRNIEIGQTKDFIRVLKDDGEVHNFEKEFDLLYGEKGKMRLSIINDSKVTKKSIAHIRDSGMKIETKRGFHTPVNYSGICVSINKEMNNFLRKCEPPKHDNWKAENYSSSKDETKVKKILLNIHDWEKECIASLANNSGEQVLSSIGMEKYFAISLDDDTATGEKRANLMSFKPLPPKLKQEGFIKRLKNTKDGYEIIDDSNENIEKQSKNGHAKKNKKHIGTGDVDGGDLSHKKGDKDEIKRIAISDIKTVYIESENCYSVSFVPKEDIDNCFLSVRRAGDDQYEKINIDKLYLKDNNTNIFREVLEFDIKSNEKKTFKVYFTNNERCALEVNCYVKK